MTCKEAKSVLTYSALNCLRNCPRKYKHRYVDNLRPVEKAHSLAFGSVIHSALETWYRLGMAGDGNRLFKVLEGIDAAYPNRDCDSREKAAWMAARAMFLGYAKRYPAEKFDVVEVEKEFEGEIRNPDTGAASRTFSMRGKVDGIVREKGAYYLLEHKTAAAVDADYLAKLWCDTQIALYAFYLREAGIPIQGIIYNVLLKSRLKQRPGESEEEFAVRHAELAAKNRSGKSSAKRQEPESDDEFLGRLSSWHSRPEAYHRELILLSRERLDMLRQEIWEITQHFLDINRRGVFLMNTSQCFTYSRPCEYLPLCQSNGNPALLGNLYEYAPPHEELSAADSPESTSDA